MIKKTSNDKNDQSSTKATKQYCCQYCNKAYDKEFAYGNEKSSHTVD